MAVYVWRDGHWVDKKTGERMNVPERKELQLPRAYWRDIPEYRSPIDGRLISSRSERREDLKRNGCVEIDPPKKPRGYKNPRFARKHGLPLRADIAERLKKEGDNDGRT